jgi:hypothetical protein
MGVRDEIRDFLLARRARVSPAQAGLAVHGERRVAALRREEVAQVAGSEPFRTLWAAYDVRTRRTGVKRFHHPLVGPITVEFESLTLPAHPGLRIAAAIAAPTEEGQA